MQKIKINNFKSLVDADLRIGKLTVFSGLNGSGKSSVLQVLAMIKQSLNQNIDSAEELKIKLRGNYVNLGKIKDIYCESAENDNLDFSFYINNRKVDLSSKIDTEVMEKDYLPCYCDNETLNLLHSSFKNFRLIQADRIVPTSLYDQASSDSRDMLDLGVKGQYCADFLSNNSSLKISDKRNLLPMQ